MASILSIIDANRVDELRAALTASSYDAIDSQVQRACGHELLSYAAWMGKDAACRVLWLHGASVNAVCAKWGSALHAACAGGRAATVRLLLQKGATCAARAADGKTALHVAASTSTAALDALLHFAAGAAAVDSADALGNTALIVACMLMDARARSDRTALLLNARADASAANLRGRHPLHYAARHGDVGSIMDFMDSGASVAVFTHDTNESPLYGAVVTGNHVALSVLLSYKTAKAIIDRATTLGQTPIGAAIKKPAVECARILLLGGAAVTPQQRASLRAWGNPEIDALLPAEPVAAAAAIGGAAVSNKRRRLVVEVSDEPTCDELLAAVQSALKAPRTAA